MCLMALFRGEDSEEAETAAMRIDAMLDLVKAYILARAKSGG